MNPEIPLPLLWSSWCHEPIQFYLRRSANPATILGSGHWIPEWYDRIHTREALKKAADLGVNFVYTHFYKGFGLQAEKKEMSRTADLVEIAADLGIKCVGYSTLPTVYYESLAAEFPDLSSHFRRFRNGDFQTYGTARYRALMCYNSKKYYEEYYPQLLEYGLKQTGLAGFHFDNAGESPCYCPECRLDFRRYLAENCGDPEQFGLPVWDYVELPAAEAELEPLATEWMRWRRLVCTRRHTQIFKCVKALKSDAVILYNPGFGRFAPGGYEPLDAPREADMVFLETARAINIDEAGRHITGTAGFRLADLCKIVPVNASWLKENGVMHPHRTQEEIALCCAEQMVFGRNCGAHWLVRPQKKGGSMICDDPEQYALVDNCFKFFLKHSDIYTKSRRLPQVKVYYAKESKLLFPEQFLEEIQNCSELLRQKKITWSFAAENSPAPAPGETLLLPGAKVLTDREIETIRSWQVNVIPLSNAGVLDEHNWERETVPFPAGNIDTLDALFKMEFPHGVIECTLSENNEVLLHLLNMANRETVKNLEVRLPEEADNVEVLSFEKGVKAELTSPRSLKITDLKTFATFKLTGKISCFFQ